MVAASLSAHSEIGSSFADSDAHLPWKQYTTGHPEANCVLLTVSSLPGIILTGWHILPSGDRGSAWELA